MDTGDEMLKDALLFSLRNLAPVLNYDIPAAVWTGNTGSNPEKNNFTISWRPEAERIIIVFTDEEPQTFLSPEVTDQVVTDALAASPNLKFYGFVDQGLDGDLWEDMINAGRGRRFILTSDANQMYNNLVSIIDEACLPRNQQARLVRNQYRMVSFVESRYDYENFICY